LTEIFIHVTEIFIHVKERFIHMKERFIHAHEGFIHIAALFIHGKGRYKLAEERFIHRQARNLHTLVRYGHILVRTILCGLRCSFLTPQRAKNTATLACILIPNSGVEAFFMRNKKASTNRKHQKGAVPICETTPILLYQASGMDPKPFFFFSP